MKKELAEMINNIRQKLEEDPSSIIYAQIKGRCESEMRDAFCTNEYYDFLKESNGARFGIIDFCNFERMEGIQFRVTDLPGAEKEWLCIGQILYEPLVMNRKSKLLYLYFQGNEDDKEPIYFGQFDDFLANYVFGAKYAEIVPNCDEDDWYAFLKENKYIE